MSKKPKNSATEVGFEVMCPCCEATLRVDPVTHAVISHAAKPVARTFADMEAAARAMREGDVRKESIFRQSVEAEKNKADVLEKKFAEAVRKAKEAPDMSKPFLRDFDLD
jgi:pyocin large subunit-like protein